MQRHRSDRSDNLSDYSLAIRCARACILAARWADVSTHWELTPHGKVTDGMSERSPVTDTVGWATATVLTAGATVPLLLPDGLMGVSPIKASSVGAASSSGCSTAAGFSGSITAGPMVLHATSRSPSPTDSRRAWLAMGLTSAACACKISALDAWVTSLAMMVD